MPVPQAVLSELMSGEWCWLERTLTNGTITNEYMPLWMGEWLATNDPQNGLTICSCRVIRDDNVSSIGRIRDWVQ